jgi:hypothetical protein
MTTTQVWLARIVRAFSLRVIFSALGVGILAGVVAGLIWTNATVPVMWGAAALFYAQAVLNDGQMLKCDACRKRVKLGASTCHHCGYTAQQAA